MKPPDRSIAVALTIMASVSATAALAGDDKPGAAAPAGTTADRRAQEKSLSDLLENHPRPAIAPPAELIVSGAPSAVAVVRLVRQLDQSDALIREAAINRLGQFPGEAAAPVVEAFAAGPLQTRLAALELLAGWNAPVAGIDPWRPETVTASRLAALRDWSTKSLKPGAATDSDSPLPTARQLTAPQLALARREIERLLAAEPADVAAILERLARVGRALLPSVREYLSRVDSDRRASG